MKDIITEMLTIQDKLCQLMIGPDWRKEGKDFSLAVAQECAEGMDHLGWKWWKKQTPNIEAAKVEVVDILHFVLADYLFCEEEMSPEALTPHLVESWDDRYTAMEDILGGDYFPNALTAGGMFRLIGMLGYADRTDFGLTCVLAEKLGMDFVELSKLYRSKVVLNTFRQFNGDRTGAYKRNWAGEEDNDVMQRLAAGLDWSLGTTGEHLYNELTAYYNSKVVEHTV
jgi:hypothetical protein